MRVVVADDSLILREGLARLLTEAGFEVVAQAADARELVRAVGDHRPSVALVNIRMPPTHTDEGIAAARTIRERWPETAILVLSQHVQPGYAIELLSEGADGIGYLLKDRVSDLNALAEGVRRVAEGGSVLDPSVVEQLVAKPRRGHDPLAELTDRERDVLAAMAEGRSNNAIAQRLFISEHTVEKHVKSIFAKLSLRDTPEDHRRVLAVLSFLDSR